MLTFFHPSFEGVYEPKRPTADFMGRMADRVRSAGLFPTAAERRNRYEVVSQSQTAVRVRSTNLLTGINVGLNDIALATVDGGRGIRYTVWLLDMGEVQPRPQRHHWNRYRRGILPADRVRGRESLHGLLRRPHTGGGDPDGLVLGWPVPVVAHRRSQKICAEVPH